MLRRALLIALLGIPALADPAPLVTGDPLACFTRIDGAGTLTNVAIAGMPFTRALHVKTGALSPTANPWDVRPRCSITQAAKQNDVVAVTFWLRTIAAPDSRGLTTFVLERNDSPYTKSVTFTAAAAGEWKKFEVPFTMAETYAVNAYNFSFWATFPDQEIEIGGLSILDYGPGVPFSSLGLTTWPYDERAADAPWRAAAAQRIERYRKGDLVVVARDDAGKPVAGAQVHVRMKRHAFGFGTAVAGDVIQRTDANGQNYRDAIKKLFNKVVTENALKWPQFEGSGRQQADYMLPWFAANGIDMVRGHNVIWPAATYLPADVQNMLKAARPDTTALRARIDKHIGDVMAYTKGKVTEWDVLNEAYTNKDLQAVLGDAEMASWFRQARAADPGIKLYINDYNILEAGGYDLAHINGYAQIIRNLLGAGAPVDGIGLQSHFDSNLTPPSRVLELIDQFAAFGKDLQVTEFDVSVADEQVQADYTRDFLTACFSHPAMKSFMIWGFWEGAHWKPQAAMIRRDWTTKPNYAVWNDLLYNQWWTDTRGTTAADGTFRTRGFLGDYEIDVTINGQTKTYPLRVTSNSEPAFANTGKAIAGVIAPAGIVNAASFQGGTIAPGEIVTIFGTGFGPAALAGATYADGQLARSAGETRVLFDGVAAPMIYAAAGQVSAIAPYGISGVTQVQVEYQGTATAPLSVPVAAAAPGIFTCPTKPGVALVINASAGNTISCNDNFVPPAPGSTITFFVTGDGAPKPAIGDGVLPAGPPWSEPSAGWGVAFGDIASARRCVADFAGLIYPGVTQINTCVPDSVPRTAAVPLVFNAGTTASAPASINLLPTYQVIWSDEFNGQAGALPDSTRWTYDLGGGGWGNSELETYTNSTDNVFQDGAGNLVIRALKSGTSYTSARIKTQGRFAATYGKVEARIRIPYGQGLWPAFWMLGADIGQVGWPSCGEIDIMENIGKEPSTIHGTVHGPGYSGGSGIGGPLTLAAGKRFADDFHIYGIEWSSQSVAFFVDGTQYFEVTPAKLPAGKTWVYQHPFFLILNVAVGGTWPGSPDATTVFPQQMLVDWVRVSQRN
ncbi:MAG: glycoside hydrolase, family 16 [Candidatus Solibacter sp.]|nr:glycoside hydrolase, family 16 [Candidatus Solibacter sp.]